VDTINKRRRFAMGSDAFLIRNAVVRCSMKLASSGLLLVISTLVAGGVGPHAETPQDKAWRILQAGTNGKSYEVRVIAVGAMGLVVRNPKAVAMVEKALEDERPEVRAAGARALGEMLNEPSIPKLRKALADKEDLVVTAAAHSLVLLHDPAGYEFYYSVLTGERKKKQGLISQEMEVLKDPKKVATYSIEEGIGFVPYAGYGVSAIEFIRQEERDEVSAKAIAARLLANDPDPQSSEALVRAISNKSWRIRMAALEAIAKRADPSLLEKIQVGMSDEKRHVRYTAAAVVIRLTDVRRTKHIGT
jgi:HEAT repeat protein